MAPRTTTTTQATARKRVESMRVECFAIAPDALGDDASKRETWIQVAKTGEWFRFGRKVALTTSDLASMVERFDALENDLVVDYEHQSESFFAPKAPAAGWLKELEIRGDGAQLWARVKFTKTAADHIRGEEYRFTSPAFIQGGEDPNTGRIYLCELTSVGLVNRPFLDGMAEVSLNSARRALMAEGSMDPIVAKLLEITGAADTDALVAWVEEKAKPPAEGEMKADGEKMRRELASRADENAILKTRLDALEPELVKLRSDRVEAEVDAVIAAKKALPAEKPALMRLALSDRKTFEELTSARVAVPASQIKGPGLDPATVAVGAPTPEFVAMARGAGLSEAAMKSAWAKRSASKKAEV